MKGFILGAGYGTRLKPITDKIPKPLIPVFNRTPLEICFDRLEQLKLNEIYVNSHHLSEKIYEFVKFKKMNLNISVEDKILGVGGGIGKLKYMFEGDDVLVHNGDIISDIDLQKLVDFHKQSKAWATLALTEQCDVKSVLIDEDNNIKTFSDKNRKGFTFTGISVISKNIYEKLPSGIFYNIITLYNEILKTKNCSKIKGLPLSEYYWADMGKPNQYWQLLNDISVSKQLTEYFKISSEQIIEFAKNKSFFINSTKTNIKKSVIFDNKIFYQAE